MERNVFLRKSIAFIMSLLLVITMLPINPVAYASTGDLTTEMPVIVVTGTDLLEEGFSNSDLKGIGNEKSYTLEELKAIETTKNFYSALNSFGSKSIFAGEGINLSSLLGNVTVENARVIASDGFFRDINLTETRYYFSEIGNDSDAGKVAVESIIAWAEGGERGITTEPTAVQEQESLQLMIGQTSLDDVNNSLFVGGANKVLVGEELPAVLSIGAQEYTRSELLLMPRADREYTYSTSGGESTDYVRGVPLAELLKGYDDESEVSIVCTDGYAPNTVYTVKDLLEGNYILAYEEGTSETDLIGIYDSAKDDESIKGYLTLYGDGDKPVKMVGEIKVATTSGVDASNSPYKHITNGGNPDGTIKYNIDAITGATLTIEGPGVTTSIPMSVRELESQDAGVVRGEYTDETDGQEYTQTYEGISLYHILYNMASGDSGIVLTDDAAKIEIKNRTRQTVASFTLEQVKEAEAAGKPILVAYGTSVGDNVRPFVYDGDINYDPALRNDDGCIKLVYDKSTITGDMNANYTEFANMAYIYVAESDAPGYTHDKAPYDNPENTQYTLSISGSEIGRQLNFTVEELEAMTDIVHRDEYSLANSTYWYVQEYEGVKLWDLLLKANVPANIDDDTLIKFSTADHYKDVETFTAEQLKNPELFGYYEKNPADLNDGLYKSVATDLKETGFPVLVAYGINGYPYVVKNDLEGFKSGLGNDGGPLRIIFGKAEYNHANGSEQAKFVDGVIVGEDINYAIHNNNPNAAYSSLASEELKVTVKGTEGNLISEKTYTVAEIEDLIYGDSVSNQEFDKAQVKDFYKFAKGSRAFTDLYEGVDLGYFLTEKVGLPGEKGTVTFTGETADDTLVVSIADVLAIGSNSDTGVEDLTSVLAFAKNGTPMVKGNDSEGYESEYMLADGTVKDIKNDGGPLSIILPENEAGEVKSLSGVTSIEINLSPDKYSHTQAPYDAFADEILTISGEGTKLTAPKTFTVTELEGKQNYVFTGDYNIKTEVEENQVKYRGLNLYEFLNSIDVGLKANAESVIVTSSDGYSRTFELDDLIKNDYVNSVTGENDLEMILAYGTAPVSNEDENGLPLVREDSDAGYDATYDNDGGPLKLVVGQMDAADTNSKKIMKDVVSIEVTAGEMTSQNHSMNAIYSQYLDSEFTLQVINGEESLFEKTYTLGELEDMSNIILRDEFTWIGVQEHEGLDVWKLVLQEAGHIAGIENPTSVKAFASDGFSKDLLSIFGKDALENGIKDGETRKSIIIAYSANGYPLVPSTSSEGYVGSSGNDGGPIRLITHLNQGACLKDTVKVIVELSGDIVTEPTVSTVLTVTQEGKEDTALDVRTIKGYDGGKASTTFEWFDKDANAIVKDDVVGIFATDLVKALGFNGDNYKVTLKTSDGFDGRGTYVDIPYEDLASQNYFIAYDLNEGIIEDLGNDGVTAYVRVYRDMEVPATSWMNRVTGIVGIELSINDEFTTYKATDNAGELPAAGVRSITFDNDGGMWVGTYGGGVAHMAVDATEFELYNKMSDPALESLFAVAIATDAEGGTWISQSGSYADPTSNRGVAYLKDGEITYYTTADGDTIPHDYVQEIQIDGEGNVWFGSFAGLTKLDAKTGEWITWDKEDGLPAMSVDNIAIDEDGGVWIGCYPDTSENAAGETTYHGGYAYLSPEGEITAYVAGENELIDSMRLADVWVRDIALDAEGGAWIVRSGSYRELDNVGGRVDYVTPEGEVIKYTGERLLLGKLTDKPEEAVSEIRTVDVDKNGGIWFGTTLDGVFYLTKPYDVVRNYSTKTMFWDGLDASNNIYALALKDDMIYIGTGYGVITGNVAFEEAVVQDLTFLDGINDGLVDITFADTNGHEAQEYIQYLAEREILNGKGNGMFDPDASVTRGEFVKILGTLANIDTSMYDTVKFSDVPENAYYAPYLAWANEMGIINGVGNNNFSPNSNITKEQISVMLVRFLNSVGYELEYTRESAGYLVDDHEIAEYSYGALDSLYRAEVIDYSLVPLADRAAEPKMLMTRAEVAKTVAKLLQTMTK